MTAQADSQTKSPTNLFPTQILARPRASGRGDLRAIITRSPT
jgi:hypothetical protein